MPEVEINIMSIHKNASAQKAGKYTMDFTVAPFGNKNKQNAQKLPPTLSNCFIVNIASEKSKRKRCSNPLANTCKMQMKGWQEHINKRHFIVNSPLSIGLFFFPPDLWINHALNSETPSLALSSRLAGLVSSGTHSNTLSMNNSGTENHSPF